MSAGEDVLFDRAGLERAFTALGERLARRGVLAARARDIDDLRLLAGMAGVHAYDDALRLCAEFFPDEPVSERSAAVLRELFD